MDSVQSSKFVLGASLRDGHVGGWGSAAVKGGGARLAFSARSGRAYCAKLLPFTTGKNRSLHLEVVSAELRALRHPHLQRIRDVYAVDANRVPGVVVISELFLAPSLQQWIGARTTPVSEVRTRRWLSQLASAVACLHSHGLLHFNIHSSNIHVVKEDQLKLGDFLAITPQEQLLDRPAISSYSMCPEVCRGEPYESQSDVWCLGAVMFEVVHQIRGGLFALADIGPKSGLIKMLRAGFGSPPPPATYTAALLGLLARTLHSEPSRRPTPIELAEIPAHPPLAAWERPLIGLCARVHHHPCTVFERVEMQRIFLENQLGLAEFRAAHDVISLIQDDTSETIVVEKLEKILAPKTLSLYLPALLRLVLCERDSYSPEQGRQRGESRHS